MAFVVDAASGALLRAAGDRASPRYCFRLGGCRLARTAGRSSTIAGRDGRHVYTDVPPRSWEPGSPKSSGAFRRSPGPMKLTADEDPSEKDSSLTGIRTCGTFVL